MENKPALSQQQMYKMQKEYKKKTQQCSTVNLMEKPYTENHYAKGRKRIHLTVILRFII